MFSTKFRRRQTDTRGNDFKHSRDGRRLVARPCSSRTRFGETRIKRLCARRLFRHNRVAGHRTGSFTHRSYASNGNGKRIVNTCRAKLRKVFESSNSPCLDVIPTRVLPMRPRQLCAARPSPQRSNAPFHPTGDLVAA